MSGKRILRFVFSFLLDRTSIGSMAQCGSCAAPTYVFLTGAHFRLMTLGN